MMDVDWKKMWVKNAGSTDLLVNSGRSDYGHLEFFLMMHDTCKALNFKKEDLVLDAGGGVGLMAMAISPFVKEITVFDYTEALVEKAKSLVQHFPNIRVFHDDLLAMTKVSDRRYTKVVVGSVLQYLRDKKEAEKALENLFKSMEIGGVMILGHNPDLRKHDAHIKSYDRLDWDEKRLKAAFEMEKKRLWFEPAELGKIAERIGFSRFYETPINPRLWQSTHMFDFVLVK